MAQRPFGGINSTGVKLDILANYVSMYLSALQNQTWCKKIYFDAFAGSGLVPLKQDEGGLFGDDLEDTTELVGSAIRAIESRPPFDRYTFVDKRRKRINALEERFGSSPLLSRMNFRCGDANLMVRELCDNTDWRKHRALVFLDPFGSQVEWSTIEKIAQTNAIDLWYLFPAGLSVFRQISNQGTVHETHAPSIDRLFGTEEWREAFLEPVETADLFSTQTKYEKKVTPESAAQFMIKRMKSVFSGSVLDYLIPLGSMPYPKYYLLFASANPSVKAKALTRRLSKAAVAATERKYGGII